MTNSDTVRTVVIANSLREQYECGADHVRLSMSVNWRATGGRVDRGEGGAVDPTSPAAFSGQFSDAACTARVDGAQTGFCFETDGKLDASGFFAEFGEQANGVFL